MPNETGGKEWYEHRTPEDAPNVWNDAARQSWADGYNKAILEVIEKIQSGDYERLKGDKDD